MESTSFCDFSSNIRKHATIVGVIFILGTISPLLIALVLYFEKDKHPEHARALEFLVKLLIGVGILELALTALYWIGFVKRVGWCLAVIIGVLTVTVMMQFIGLFGSIAQKDINQGFMIPLGLVINGYRLQVTHQLYKANSENTVSRQGFSA